MPADRYLNPQLFDPGPRQDRGTPLFHYGEEPTFDTTRPREAHAGTEEAALQHAQNRFHRGSIHHLTLRPEATRYNTRETPAKDHWANAVGTVDLRVANSWGGQHTDRAKHHGKAIFYTNAVEDPGSVSVVAPSSAYEYHGSEPHTPVRVTDHDYHTKTEYGRERDVVGFRRPGVNLQPKLFGPSGSPSPYLTGMPDNGVPAGRPRRNLPSLEETFSKL